MVGYSPPERSSQGVGWKVPGELHQEPLAVFLWEKIWSWKKKQSRGKWGWKVGKNEISFDLLSVIQNCPWTVVRPKSSTLGGLEGCNWLGSTPWTMIELSSRVKPFHRLWNPDSSSALARTPRITNNSGRETSSQLASLPTRNPSHKTLSHSHPTPHLPIPQPSGIPSNTSFLSLWEPFSPSFPSGAPGTIHFWPVRLGKPKPMQFQAVIIVPLLPAVLASQLRQWAQRQPPSRVRMDEGTEKKSNTSQRLRKHSIATQHVPTSTSPQLKMTAVWSPHYNQLCGLRFPDLLAFLVLRHPHHLLSPQQHLLSSNFILPHCVSFHNNRKPCLIPQQQKTAGP